MPRRSFILRSFSFILPLVFLGEMADVFYRSGAVRSKSELKLILVGSPQRKGSAKLETGRAWSTHVERP